MKALRTKVILSGIVLVFAFIATIGTTFAWFTVSQIATVETLTLNVTAEDSLLIQVADHAEVNVDNAPTTATGYQTVLSNQDLIDANYLYDTPATPADPWRLRPVTAISSYYDGNTPGAVTPFDLRTIVSTDPAKTINSEDTANDLNSSTGRYIELKFYVFYQSGDNTSADLVLSSPSVVSNASNTASTDIANAVRLSVVVTDGTTAGTEYMFGNTIDFGFSYSVGDDGYVDTPAAYTATNNLQTFNMTDGSTLTSANVDNDENVLLFSAASSTSLYSIAPDTPYLVTVRIFVEGWASATTDAIIDAIFDIGFGFTIINEQ